MLLFILFPIMAQAAEYREVKAEDILKHIENGDDVNLTHCRVVGELNVSRIKLETVQNPNYNETLNGELANESISVIESNITIKDSIFEKGLKLSNVVFNDSVDFTGSTFNGSVDFSGLTFNAPIYLDGSTFNAPTNFTGSTFNVPAEFVLTTFNAPIYFNRSTFNEYVNFLHVTFNAPTYFTTPFIGNLRVIEGTDFNGFALFHYSIFNYPVDFTGSTFANAVDFTESTFNDSADFSFTIFYNPVDFKGPKNFKKIITNDEKICNVFREYYRNEARYEDADNIYYDYRKIAQNSKDTSFSKLMDIISWATCGYGLRLSHTLKFVVGIIIFFAFIYLALLGINPKSYATKKLWILAILEALLFSIRHFTTLGSAECPKDFLWKLLVTLEGLLGWIMLGIFMATLTNLMIRT